MSLNRRTLLALAGIGFPGTGLAGCLDNVTMPGDGAAAAQQVTAPNARPDATEEQIAEYIRENVTFGIDLLRSIAEEESQSNLMVSPISVSAALGMTLAGTRGDTEAEIREALRFPHGQETLHPTIGALQYELNEVASEDVDGDLELAIANRLWGQADYPFLDAYLETIEDHYGAGFEEVDFVDDPEGSRETINEWVAERTNDRIDELFPGGSIDALTRLVITNAVYLLADWARPFDPDDTTDNEFTALDGSTAEVAMMHQTDDFRYLPGHEAGYEALELPYVGESLSMVVILPAADTFAAFEADLDGGWMVDRFAELDAADEREVGVSLPRFEFETAAPLGNHLAALGMPSAFDPDAANFEGLVAPEDTIERLFIHEVFHDTFVAVDEEGTEAAAATGVQIGTDSAPPQIIVDRPFLFLIRHRGTDTILFLGRVVDSDGMV